MKKQNNNGFVVLFAIGSMMLCSCYAWTISLPSTVLAPRAIPIKTKMPVRSGAIHTSMIGTGFSFEDGEQILVSVQKPFGIVLEQGSEENEDDDRIIVTEVDPNGSAGKAGVREGDVLVAVQNASTLSADLDQVLEFIATKCPRVVNLRFERAE